MITVRRYCRTPRRTYRSDGCCDSLMGDGLERRHGGSAWFFDLEDRYAQLSKAGDPLEKLASVVDFEPFRYRLVKALKRSDGAKGGRPPYDPVSLREGAFRA